MTSYYEKSKRGFNENYSAFDGTAKNFWKSLIRAHNETEAKELKRLMEASSLSHAQAQRLFVYALRNCSDDGFLFIKRNLLMDFYGTRTLDRVIELVEKLLTFDAEDERQQYLTHRFCEQRIARDGEVIEVADGHFKLLHHFISCSKEELEMSLKFIRSFCVNYPFGSREEADDIAKLCYSAEKAQWQTEELLDREYDSLVKRDSVNELKDEIYKRPLQRLDAAEEQLSKWLERVKEEKNRLHQSDDDNFDVKTMGLSIADIIEETEMESIK